MVKKILHQYIPNTRELTNSLKNRITIPGFASKLKRLECDVFSIKKLPAPNCAGSFCLSTDFKQAIEGVDIYAADISVNQFLHRVKIKNEPELTKSINKVLKDMPELIHIFSPRVEYKDGLEKHVLATFQELLKHSEYKTLGRRKQIVLELATLNHDTGKAVSKTLKPDHPELSAKIIVKRLKSLAIQTEDKELILKLIRHHHYSENIAKGKMTYQDYAKIFTEDEFKLLKILTDADLQSKRGNVQYRIEENKIFFAEQDAVYKSLRETKTETARKPLNVYA